MLRTVLLWVGGLLVAAGAVVCLATRSAAGVGLFMIGAVLVIALLIERHRYKGIVDRPPGPDWQATGERFVEPGSDAPVEVYSQVGTGKRIYVRLGAAPRG
ncbi:MAG TPA: hypothetical protein VL614_20325 [Acetobacteraceae bacterium]|jgi:hypothetical protein|nr:hypothetical protein [Acetobacteraceae bacterium]